MYRTINVQKYRGITLKALVSPSAAVRYLLHMDPRAAALPLAMLLAAFVVFVSGAVVFMIVTFIVTWMGLGGVGAFAALLLAPALGGGTLLMSLRHFRESPPPLAMRSVLLLAFPMAWSVGLGTLCLFSAFLQIDWLASLAGFSFTVSLLWWPVFVIAGEMRLKRARRTGVCCPACGYSLAGLPSARCPECGLDVPPA